MKLLNLILNALKSKTIIGIVIAAIGETSIGSDIIVSFGITDATASVFIDQVAKAAGTILAVYGRIVAKKPLHA